MLNQAPSSVQLKTLPFIISYNYLPSCIVCNQQINKSLNILQEVLTTNARQDFNDHLKLRGFSNCTIDNYIENISHFARYFNKAPNLLCNDHVKQYLLHLRECRKLQARTINLHFYSLRGYYKDFRKRPEVMENLRRMKEPVFVTVILSREEIHAMLECTANLKIKVIIALLYSSGLRFTECSLLKINDFDKQRPAFHIKNANMWSGTLCSTRKNHTAHSS